MSQIMWVIVAGLASSSVIPLVGWALSGFTSEREFYRKLHDSEMRRMGQILADRCEKIAELEAQLAHR